MVDDPARGDTTRAGGRRHADRPDPMRQRILDALAMRARDQPGDVQRILEARLSALADAWSVPDASPSPAGAATTTPSLPARGRLGELLDRLATRQAGAIADCASAAPSLPETLLAEFRQTWATLRTESQLRQSLQQAPADAGPLNSATLVHRSIALMRELSPGYLQHFLAYTDVLAWMEQTRVPSPAAKAAPQPRRGSTRRSRKPRP